MNSINTMVIWVAFRKTEIVYKVDPMIRDVISSNLNIKTPKSLKVSIDTKSDLELYYGKNFLESQIPTLLLGFPAKEIFKKFHTQKIEFRNSADNELIHSINKDG